MKEFIESRPQELCLMCGKCCRVVTASSSHEELLKLAKDNDEEAKNFLSIFEPYNSAEDARKVSAETVDHIYKYIKLSDTPEREVTFYKCKHLQDNNLCGIYKERLPVCDRFPSSPWIVAPPGCGFEGWLFQKREEIKHQIRKHKETKIEFETRLHYEKNPEIIEKLQNGIKKIDAIVERYAKYGSKDW